MDGDAQDTTSSCDVRIVRRGGGKIFFFVVKRLNQTHKLQQRDMWRQLGVRGFYKGFWPFGFIQGCYKGLPVLFTQSEMKYRYALWGLSPYYANVLAGVTAGVVQGAMVAPTQRLKSIVGTNPKAGAVSTQIITDTIAREGMSTVFRGTGVMMARRGVDWGIRFYGKGIAERYFMRGKAPGEKLTIFENFATGFFGGAFSAFNHPLDVWVANCQKHREGRDVNAFQVLKDLNAEARANGFVKVWFRGVGMRVLHSAYHTAWMAGLGTVIYDQYRDWQDGK